MLSYRADFVAVLSNDSDFYTLFDKLHEIISGRGHPLHRVPFLWIVAPNGNNLSPEIKRFLPLQFVWDLSGVAEHNLPESPGGDEPSDIPNNILKGIVAAMDTRRQYRASELHDICKELYPSERLSKQITASFGMFLKSSTPALSDMGVEVISTSNTSRYVRH